MRNPWTEARTLRREAGGIASVPTALRSSAHTGRLIWRKLRRVRLSDITQLVALAVLLLAIEAGLRLRQTSAVTRMCGVGFPPAHRLAPLPVLTGSEQRWLLNVRRVIRRWPFDASCLRRSLLLGWVLRRHHPQLVVGVRRDEGGVLAHAWIRIGENDLDSDATNYVELETSSARDVDRLSR